MKKDFCGKRSMRWRELTALLLVSGLGLSAERMVGPWAPPPANEATESFIAHLDVARYEFQGTDYTNPDRSPLRLGKPLEQLDVTFDYDYALLEQTEERLKNVNRDAALRAIFAQVTHGAASDKEVHLRLLAFLHRAIHHNLIQPTHRDHEPVFDPLVLLELGEGRCGHVNRVAVDLFLAAGYRARLVQAAHHLLAEVYYGGAWHYFDGDIFGNGETVMKADGTIPSMAELSCTPYAIDGLVAFWEPDFANRLVLDAPYYPAFYYFGRAGYTTDAVHYTKRYGTAQAQAQPEFAWNALDTELDAGRRLYSDLQLRRAPGAPLLERVAVYDEGIAHGIALTWQPSHDPDGDLAAYRVFVSRHTRGWSYNGVSTAPALAPRKSHPEGWQPECYTARYSLPPGEVATVTTRDTSVHLKFDGKGPFYISVMPVGAHGTALGRHLFPVSEEIVVNPNEPLIDSITQ